MALYLISDLHLEEKRPDISRAFFHYLENLPGDAEALYILGDLFEVWIGDDDDDAFNRTVMKRLRSAADTGLPIKVIVGNRDFLLDDPSLIEYHGTPYLLMHGDSLCTRDSGYMKFRAQVRDPDWQRDLLKQPLAERRALARRLRDESMQANAGKTSDIMDVTPEEVLRVMSEQRCHHLIHGHTHRPAQHDLLLDGQPATRWVLGDWDRRGWQLRVDENGPALSSFALV